MGGNPKETELGMSPIPQHHFQRLVDRKVIHNERDLLVRLNLEGFGELIQGIDHLELVR